MALVDPQTTRGMLDDYQPSKVLDLCSLYTLFDDMTVLKDFMAMHVDQDQLYKWEQDNLLTITPANKKRSKFIQYEVLECLMSASRHGKCRDINEDKDD